MILSEALIKPMIPLELTIILFTKFGEVKFVNFHRKGHDKDYIAVVFHIRKEKVFEQHLCVKLKYRGITFESHRKQKELFRYFLSVFYISQSYQITSSPK